jgi:hypothetical protein
MKVIHDPSELLTEVIRSETHQNYDNNQHVDHRHALKNGIAIVISVINKSDKNIGHIIPNFGKSGVEAKLTKFINIILWII